MPDLAPLSPPDVNTIVDSALAGLDVKLTADRRRDVVATLERDLRFDHEDRTFAIVDEAGHPRIKVSPTGIVANMDLSDFLREAAGPSTAAKASGDPANPWSKAGWSRTRQAVLTNTKPDEAKRLKVEAGR